MATKTNLDAFQPETAIAHRKTWQNWCANTALAQRLPPSTQIATLQNFSVWQHVYCSLKFALSLNLLSQRGRTLCIYVTRCSCIF